MPYSPLMRSVITAGANSIAKLSTLLVALDIGPNLPLRFTMLQIEFDLSGVGNVFIGNDSPGSPLSATNCGRHLVPAQNQNVAVFDTGIIIASDISIKADNAIQQLNIIALPIGM